MVVYPLLGVGFCRAVFQAQSRTSKCCPLGKDTLPRRYRQVPVQTSHLPKSENYLLSLGFHFYNEYQVLTGQGDD